MDRFINIKNIALSFFLRYFFLLTLLFLTIASIALRGVISAESNPFFYVGF